MTEYKNSLTETFYTWLRFRETKLRELQVEYKHLDDDKETSVELLQYYFEEWISKIIQTVYDFHGNSDDEAVLVDVLLDDIYDYIDFQAIADDIFKDIRKHPKHLIKKPKHAYRKPHLTEE